ncbi:NAD(P)-dependent oxidoreductase [Georgenia satyanarayanai]|uniref:NAD-dependent epimerase/dehydratase family protein n=1 Tax=Georgenia satyanarayanai TaxID=860221 RepID=UPI002041B0E5|nr:NAD(P)-dependent oxidoreductase [Georgenia satyanarayanai]MCM3659783.1 NAD(P)-dependent oxidoreductase [Georgenia satyanarayanai]
MTVFITGARGFVMSVLMRRLLESDPDCRIVAADITEPDDLLIRSLGEGAGRVEFRMLDVRDGHAVSEAISAAAPDVVVHGATVTHVPEWEVADPARFIDVNVMGTTRVLDAARSTPSVRKVVHVSSAAVYGPGTGDPGPLPEDAPLLPDEMYGVSKVASELVARRFGQLYDLDVPIVRFTKVFGPMERPSASRASMSLPFHLASALVNGHPTALTERTSRAVGDWVSAVDVADALVALCGDTAVRSGTYNLASGSFVDVPELIDLFGADVVEAPAGGAAVDMDPDLRDGKNGCYSVQRAADDLGWRPRDLRTQVAEYVAWAHDHPECFPARA